MESVAIFVDGANMFYVQKKNGWHIDFNKVFGYFSHGKNLHAAFYYTATPPYSERERVEGYRRFREALIHIGYTVRDKEVRVLRDPTTGQTKLKGNLDIEMVMDLVSNRSHYDEAVLVGGDSDFVPVVRFLRDEGKRVTVVGQRGFTSLELINCSSKYIDVNDIRTYIEKTKK